MMTSPLYTFFPLYITELGGSVLLIANIAAAKQIAGLLASVIGGTLVDALGRKRTLLLGNLGGLLSTLAFLLASPNWIGLFWVIGGFGQGLHTVGGQSYLMDAANPYYLGVISALYNWGHTLGGALGSSIVGLLLQRGGYSLLAQGMLAFAVCTIAVNQFILPPSTRERQSRRERTRRFLGHGGMATRPTVLVLAALRFIPTLHYAAMLILIPLLLDAGGASEASIAWYASASWVLASLAQLSAGRSADRWGPKWPAAAAFALLLASAIVIGIWPHRVAAVYTFGAMGMAAAWSLSTLLPSLVAQSTVPEERGRVLGFIHLWWNLAMVVGSLAGGALFEVASGLPFLVAGVINIGSIALLFVYFRLVAQLH
jgi:MFS family permease